MWTQWIISWFYHSFHLFLSLPVSSCLFLPFPLPIHLPSVQVIALWPVLIRWKEVRITLATTICSLPGSSCKDWRNMKKTIKQPPGIFLVCFYKMCYLINLFLRFCKTVDCKKDDSAMSVMMHLDLRFKQNDNEIWSCSDGSFANDPDIT